MRKNANVAVRKITSLGSSIGVAIPRDWGFKKGDFVILELNNGSIIIRKVGS